MVFELCILLNFITNLAFALFSLGGIYWVLLGEEDYVEGENNGGRRLVVFVVLALDVISILIEPRRSG